MEDAVCSRGVSGREQRQVHAERNDRDVIASDAVSRRELVGDDGSARCHVCSRERPPHGRTAVEAPAMLAEGAGWISLPADLGVLRHVQYEWRAPEGSALAMAVHRSGTDLLRQSRKAPLLPSALQSRVDVHQPVLRHVRQVAVPVCCRCDEDLVGRSSDKARRQACENPGDPLRIPAEL